MKPSFDITTWSEIAESNIEKSDIGSQMDVTGEQKESDEANIPEIEGSDIVKSDDLLTKLDRLEEQNESNEVENEELHALNLNSHSEVFNLIMRNVTDTPQEKPFLSILQHLLRVDPKEPMSDQIWDTAEKLVHKASLLENKSDSEVLLRKISRQNNLNRLRSIGK